MNRSHRILMLIWLFMGMALGTPSVGAAEWMRLPLRGMAERAEIQLGGTPTDIGRHTDALDNPGDRVCRFVRGPAHLEITFPRPIRLTRVAVRFAGHFGKFLWQLEQSADFTPEADTGTWQTVMAERDVGSDTDDDVEFSAPATRFWRLTCREDGGDPFLHLKRLDLFCAEDDYLAYLSARPSVVPFPLVAALRQGLAQISATPTDIGKPADVLPVPPQPEAVSRFVSQPAHLTVTFAEPITLCGARTRFSHHSSQFHWGIEAADSSDLTFSPVCRERTIRQDSDDEALWQPFAARVWRLICREDRGDRFLHLRSLVFLQSTESSLEFDSQTGAVGSLEIVDIRDNEVGSSLSLRGNQMTALHVRGRQADGATVDLGEVSRLVVSDPRILEVVNGRYLRPRTPGTSVVHAEFGSLRSRNVEVIVAPTVDLQVLLIERNPSFPRYHPHYESFRSDERFAEHEATFFVGYDAGESDSTPRLPAVGDPVTFTARVANVGTVPVENAVLHWCLDEQEIEPGLSLSLGPGETAEAEFPWIWAPEPHQIEVRVDAVGEKTPEDNVLARSTHALEFYFLIEEGYRAQFAANSELVAAPKAVSIVGWIHQHFARFNAMFAEKGCRERLAVGWLRFVPDRAPDPPADLIGRYARFPPRFFFGDCDWRLGGSGYYHQAEDIDYGFLHEMAHQLGMIDLYQLNLSPNDDPISGKGFSMPNSLMTGCGSTLCEHEARSMDSWFGFARGFFGQFLYDLPAEIGVRLHEGGGRNFGRCPVRVFQKVDIPANGRKLCPQPKFTGQTDEDGVFMFPNVPIDDRGFLETPMGNRLKPNPFGHIACVGTNGLFLIEVETAQGKHYGWFPVTEANLAYWGGEKDRAVIPLRVSPASPR
jgi:hypothetical protein